MLIESLVISEKNALMNVIENEIPANLSISFFYNDFNLHKIPTGLW